jgi:hypothetical protein
VSLLIKSVVINSFVPIIAVLPIRLLFNFPVFLQHYSVDLVETAKVVAAWRLTRPRLEVLVLVEPSLEEQNQNLAQEVHGENLEEVHQEEVA